MRPAVSGAVLAVSLGVHAALFAAAGRFGEAPRPRTTVTLEVAPARPRAAPPVEEPPAPAPSPRVPSPPRARRATAVARAAAPARPAAAPAPAAPPAAEAPVDMTGVTLTSDGSGAWASAVGNGAAMAGPLPAYRGRPRAAAQARGGGAGDGARVVDLADLARKPEPPALTGALERAYPAEARRLGLSGEAVVKARVRPDGAIDRARVVSATDGWFGDACRRVLVASRWSPPVDRGGAPCATEIRYVCHFEVAR